MDAGVFCLDTHPWMTHKIYHLWPLCFATNAAAHPPSDYSGLKWVYQILPTSRRDHWGPAAVGRRPKYNLHVFFNTVKLWLCWHFPFTNVHLLQIARIYRTLAISYNNSGHSKGECFLWLNSSLTDSSFFTPVFSSSPLLSICWWTLILLRIKLQLGCWLLYYYDLTITLTLT